MKKKFTIKLLLAVALIGIGTMAFAQADSIATSQAATSKPINIGNLIIGVLILAGALFAIGHMVYVLIQTKRFHNNYSVEYFKNARLAAGKEPESSTEENQQCNDLLSMAFGTWTNIEPAEDGMEYRKPKRMKEILLSATYLQQVVEIAPTDMDVVETLNSYKDVVHSNESRSFDGSWKLITLGIIISLLATFIGMSATHGFIYSFFTVGIFFWLPVVVYYISSLTPQFLIEKRANRGGGNVSTGLVAIVLGVLGSGYTVRTYYTDGTHEDDNSSHMFALIIGIFVAVIVALTIIFWAFFNYLRNYVLYF